MECADSFAAQSARFRPMQRPYADRDGSTITTMKTNTKTAAVVVVGISDSQRCGSRKHNLAQCRQSAQLDNP
jgi:hypothetical protein